ncbi:Cdc6/Cdc18 family protein [Ferroplasma sp.]|uniref:Cdc6/Cdc18 family protein n=1 Tax=Ferroplasma sp. TaxID=2591003 RepID=UPI00307D1E63
MIVSNPAPLDISYVPEKLFFRDDKISTIRSSVILPAKNGITNNVIIYGNSGTGKTSAVKVIMRDNAPIIYENALSFKNVKNLLEHVISRLGRPVSYHGLSFSDIFSTINSIISFRGNMVLVIDEATSLLKDDDAGIYNLFRASEIYGTRLSTILISMENPFTYLDRKYGTVTGIKFDNYSSFEINKIIADRASMSLEPGTYSDSILKYISDISGQFGSARFAIELLQKAAYMGEYRLSKSIENDDVRSAVSLINPYITESKLSLLDREDLIVLLSICILLPDSISTNIKSIEEEVKLLGEEYGIGLKKTEIYKIIRKLENIDIISSQLKSSGNKSSVSKLISINDVPVSILSMKLRDLISRI